MKPLRPLLIVIAVALSLQAPAAQAQEEQPAEAAEVEALRGDYVQRAPERAARRIAGDPRLVIWEDERVTARATFRSRADGLILRVTRRGAAAEPLAVAFPPGIVARCTRQSDARRLPQDLLLLRAPVIALAAGQASGLVQVPVACASFRRQGPRGGERYELSQVEPDGPLGRLARVLCSGEPPDVDEDPALALAIWIAHEGLGWQRFVGSSFTSFRPPRRRVERRHAPAAGRLLREAGLEPLRLPFFRDAPAEARPTEEDGKEDDAAQAEPGELS